MIIAVSRPAEHYAALQSGGLGPAIFLPSAPTRVRRDDRRPRVGTRFVGKRQGPGLDTPTVGMARKQENGAAKPAPQRRKAGESRGSVGDRVKGSVQDRLSPFTIGDKGCF